MQQKALFLICLLFSVLFTMSSILAMITIHHPLKLKNLAIRNFATWSAFVNIGLISQLRIYSLIGCSSRDVPVIFTWSFSEILVGSFLEMFTANHP